jgi:ADP-ribosylglycohydrolase
MDPEHLRDRFYGCLAGVAVGDAMGMPTAGYTPEEIAERFGVVEGFLDAPEDHPFHRGLRRGEVTDDTELTLLVVDMILRDKEVSAEGMARRLTRWAEEREVLDTDLIGPSTRSALRELMAGGDPREAGRRGTTNGAAMKIAPIGLLHKGEPETVVDDVVEVCLPTHGTSVAISAASAIAGAVAEAINPSGGLETVLEAAVRCADLGELRGRKVAYPSIGRRIEFALELIEGLQPPRAAKTLYRCIGADMSCHTSIPTAIALFSAAQGDPMKAILSAVNIGGDTDTIASMTGAIAGAYSGIEVFPEEAINLVEEMNDIRLAEIAWALVDRVTL